MCLIAFILYSFLISGENYCDKPAGANMTGLIKYTHPINIWIPGFHAFLHDFSRCDPIVIIGTPFQLAYAW